MSIVIHKEAHDLHLAEIEAMKIAGLTGKPWEIMPEQMDEYPSLVGIEATRDDESHFLFSGTFDQIFADVVDIMAARITLDNRLKGFWPDGTNEEDSLRLQLYPETKGRNFGEIIGLIHSEVTEAFEPTRKGGLLAPRDDKLTEESAVACELGDAIIRAMDVGGAFHLKIGATMVKKLAYNRTRPYKHGKLA